MSYTRSANAKQMYTKIIGWCSKYFSEAFLKDYEEITLKIMKVIQL